LLLPPALAAEECASLLMFAPLDPCEHEALVAAKDAATSGSQEPAAKPCTPGLVDPKLLKKDVVVHLHDGRAYRGKLVELTQESLRLRMLDRWDSTQGKAVYRTEEIALTDVAGVERQQGQRSRAWLAVAIAGLAIGAVAVGALIAAMQD